MATNIVKNCTFVDKPKGGGWEISPDMKWQLPSKPNWRARMMARLFLGWKWEDA